MKLYATSRISRRLGERLFLKGERDFTPKSAMVRKPYPPGMHQKTRRRRASSDFSAMLLEKQKIRFSYVIPDTMLRKYALKSRVSTGTNPTAKLLELLELRLDNVVYRLGFASSRIQARHLVSYGHVASNAKPVKSPSRHLRAGDKVSIRESSRSLPIFTERVMRLKNYEPPGWLKLDRENWTGEVMRMPNPDDQLINADLGKVIEYYSR